MRIFLLAVLLFNLSVGEVLAQKRKNWVKENSDSITWLGNFFNVQLSVGVGGGRIGLISPMPSIKLGPLTARYLSYDDSESEVFRDAFQMDIELFSWNTFSSVHRDYMALSYASVFHFDREITTSDYRIYMLGWTHYKIDNRWSFAVRGGFARRYDNTYDYDTYRFRTTTSQPLMGELSFSYALYNYRRQRISVMSPEYFPPVEDEKIVPEVSAYRPGYTGKWFNPYVSIGVGSDRLKLTLPAVGIRVSGLSLQMSYLNQQSINGTIQFELPNSFLRAHVIRKRSVSVYSVLSRDQIYTGLLIGFHRYYLNSHQSVYYKFGLGNGVGYDLLDTFMVALGNNFYAKKTSTRMFGKKVKYN